MIRNIFYLFLVSYSVYPSWLTLEDAINNTPFKIASLGMKVPVSDEDAILIRGLNQDWKQWYKVSFNKMDTTLFLDSSYFVWKDKELYVNSLSISKDSKKILIATDKKQLWRHSSTATYFILDIKEKKIIPLTDNNESLRNVKFSPDGLKVAYVRIDNNLYVYNLINNRERKLTNTGSNSIMNGFFGWLYEEELTGYDGYRWSPDSEAIIFWENDESQVPEFKMINELKFYPTITSLRYPKAGGINPKMRIGLVRVHGYGKKWIDIVDSDDGYLPWMEWIDNKNFAYLKMDRLQKNWDLFIVNKSSGKTVKILTESDSEGWLDNDGQIKFLKNGKILWISEKSGFKHIWMSKHTGSRSWQITQGSWEVSRILHIDEENKLIYFTANKNSVHEKLFYSIRFDGTDLKLLTKEDGNHRIEITGGGSYFIDYYSSNKRPPVIDLRNLKNGNLIKRLAETDKVQFDEYNWSYPKFIQFKSEDSSVLLDGMITLPPNHNPKKKYPVIVHGYGMPGTQIIWNRWSSTWSQYLAQQGYIVFSMDSRGMSGRGEEFKNLSYGDMSKYLTLDHRTGIEYLIDSGLADPKRIGAWGWSGGGYFTCLMITRLSDYVTAGVAIAPCTDFRLYDTAYTERSMGFPSENVAGYDSTSVISWVHKMKGSLLLMHGSADDNVHSQHTSKFVDAALKAGKNIEWYQYPNRNHGIYGGGARKHLYKKMIEFFRNNL